MTDRTEWQGRVGRSWADEWRRTDLSFRWLTEILLEAALSDDFKSVVDIGCGAGEVACALAGARPTAEIEGVDVSADLLEVARSRCPVVAFENADASQFAPAGSPPDLLISRHGVMFFADPVAAFGHLRQIAAPDARLLFTCFRPRAANAWVTELATAVGNGKTPADSIASPGPFAFGDRVEVLSMLEASGWQGVQFQAIDYGMIAGVGEDAVDQAMVYFQRIGPAASALAEMEDARRDAALRRVREVLERHVIAADDPSALGAKTVALPAAAWLVSARAPG